MKNIFICALCCLTSLGGLAGETISVASANELSTAINKANVTTEELVIELSGAITPMSQLVFSNKSSSSPIKIVGPATIKTQPIVISVGTSLRFENLTIEGLVTVHAGDVTFANCVLSQEVVKKGGSVTLINDNPDATTFPSEAVICASGQRQVYFGWPTMKGVTSVKAQVLVDKEWIELVDKDIITRSPTSAEPTIEGWESIRYIGAMPGSTASYRLVATTEKGTTFESKAVQVTTAAAGTLHSRPGAKATIYLDFDGYVDDFKANVSMMRATFAASDRGKLNYVLTPKFSENSKLNIEEIWRLVAEDFLIFDVDVTTEEPTLDRLVKSDAKDDEYGKRVIIDCLKDGTAWYPAGGMSGLGSFGFREDRPAYIFGYSSRDNIAGQITHEVSHTCGLTHDEGPVFFEDAIYQDPNTGKWITLKNEFVDNEYYAGQTIALNCRWYPVMGGVPMSDGGDYFNQFSNGNYDGAVNKEDDFAVMLGLVAGDREASGLDSVIAFPDTLYPNGRDAFSTRNLTLVADEAGDTIQDAKAASEREGGLIGRHVSGTTTIADVDVYSFVAGAGEVTISVSPEYRGSSYGCSLDAMVELLDAKGNVIDESQDPLQNDADGMLFRKAELKRTVSAGTYFVRVSGGNHPITLNYVPEGAEAKTWQPNAKDNYGSVGPYVLTIEVSAAENHDGDGETTSSTVEPFMSESWNQTSPWNDYMPSYLPADERADTGMEAYKYRAPAGCVATAMAQVLDYWQWPKRYLTIPRHSHEHSVGVEDKYAFSLSMTFDGHGEFKFDGSADDMARLTYMCASLGNLAFNRSGTGGVPSTVVSNLSDYYECESNASWDRIHELLSKGYPIPATITGHAIVLHGWKRDEKGNDYYYKNNGYSGSGDGWIPRSDIKTTTVCYPKKKALFDPMQSSYGPAPTISWSFPKRYETVCKDEFDGFKIFVYGKGEKTPSKTYEAAASARNITFTELAAGVYTIEIAPIFNGAASTDMIDSKPLVITEAAVTPLSMELSTKDVTTDFKATTLTATCSPAVKEVNVFPNITEFRQQATKGQEYAYCYLADGFKSNLKGNVATITIDPAAFPQRLKGQNLILTVQAVDAQENEVYEDVIVRLVEEGTDPGEGGEEGGDGGESSGGEGTDPGTEPGTDPTKQPDYILISPSDFVSEWKGYVEKRKIAHPKLTFAVKNAEDIYKDYGDKGGSPTDMIKSYIAQQAAKGTQYFVLGAAWSNISSMDGKSEESFVVPGENGNKYATLALSLDNTIPGFTRTFGGKTLATDYPYALVDGDEKPDVVVARIPLVLWPKADGSIATFTEIIKGYGKKVTAVEDAAFLGTHRYACAGAQLGATVARGSEYWPTERHHYADGYYDFFDSRHPDSATDGMIAARRRFRDFFAMYNPVKGAMVIPLGNAATDFFDDKSGWEALIAKCHGLEDAAYQTGITDARFRETSTLVKFGIFAMPCLTGRPDRTTTWGGWSNLRYPSMGVAAICNPTGGEVVGFHNTHDGAGENKVELVTTNRDAYATQYEGFLLTRLCKEHKNAGLAWKAAHEDYIDKHGTGTWHLWTAYESLLYGDPLVEMSAVNEPVCGSGKLPAKVLFK